MTGVPGTSLHSAGDLEATEGGAAASAILRGVPKPASDPVEGVSGRQSPAGPTCSLSGAALEESAHALLAGPDSRMTVSIVPDAVSGGRCLPEGPDEGYAPTWDDAGRAAAELHARYACAGAVAKHLAFGNPIQLHGVDATLFAQALNRLSCGSRLLAAGVEREILEATEQQLRDGWPAVLRLAAALEERKTLDADAVHRLLWSTP